MTTSGETARLVERLARVISASDDGPEAWDREPEADREMYRANARAVLADLGIRAVARVQEEPLGTGAEWIDDAGEVLHRENPHRLADYTVLYTVADLSGGRQGGEG